MVAVARILFATLLGISAANAAQITGPCPSGQQLISNNKCCPGYSIVDKDDTVCCVTDTDNSCAGIGLCGNGSVGGSCKAKVSINDPDYDQKVKNAQSGTADSQSSSSSSSASASPTASSAPSSTGSDSAATGSSTDSDSSTSSSPAKNAATTANNAMLGMVVGLAAVSAIFYGL
ncbi:hypothetical protein GGS26DRAFT_592522 [Hypomontagnella submonticulosa]|nr:hypothetical protein GGS26DRAFT_592522 [Hypomontagnella submonticulosa]